ncbi:hypothetical protein Hanom_Chr10g00925501 [Helianthus anomalus]
MVREMNGGQKSETNPRVKAAREKEQIRGCPFIHSYMAGLTHQDPCSYHRITMLLVFGPKSSHGPLISRVTNHFYYLYNIYQIIKKLNE